MSILRTLKYLEATSFYQQMLTSYQKFCNLTALYFNVLQFFLEALFNTSNFTNFLHQEENFPDSNESASLKFLTKIFRFNEAKTPNKRNLNCLNESCERVKLY